MAQPRNLVQVRKHSAGWVVLVNWQQEPYAFSRRDDAIKYLYGIVSKLHPVKIEVFDENDAIESTINLPASGDDDARNREARTP